MKTDGINKTIDGIERTGIKGMIEGIERVVISPDGGSII